MLAFREFIYGLVGDKMCRNKAKMYNVIVRIGTIKYII